MTAAVDGGGGGDGGMTRRRPSSICPVGSQHCLLGFQLSKVNERVGQCCTGALNKDDREGNAVFWEIDNTG